MDDLTTLERQIEGQLNGFVGPVLPVDDAAIFTAITAPQSPRSRFGSMFSATKLVVAGAIVALFSGILLTGLTSTQQDDEVLPPAASASPVAAPVDQVRLPTELPAGTRSGTLETPLGPARWAQVEDGVGGVDRPTSFVPAPGGFVALDTPHGQPARLLRSSDLIEWIAEPVDIEGFGHGLGALLWLEGGTYWLGQGSSLWRSEDTIMWQLMGQDDVASPFPASIQGGRDLGDPVSSGGVTLVPVTFGADLDGSDLGVPDLRGDWWLEREETGIYLGVSKGQGRADRVHARLRFEETGSGLSVFDADDDTELATLEGVGLDFVDFLVRHGHAPEASRLARVDGDRLVPVEGPDLAWHVVQLYSNSDGFTLQTRSPDSDVADVWFSSDGSTWSAGEPLGDDPGEPAGELDWRHNTHDPVLFDRDGRQYTTSDGVTWREGEYPERLRHEDAEAVSTRVGSSWLLLSKDELSFKSDDDDGWVTVDISELGIGAAADRLLASSAADEYGWERFEHMSRVNAVGPDTVVVTLGSDQGVDTSETWIITLDAIE